MVSGGAHSVGERGEEGVEAVKEKTGSCEGEEGR